MTTSCVMEGSLDEYDLVNVVQTVGAARYASNLELRDEDGQLVGSIQLEAGHIVSAYADELRGLEAVRRLLKTPRPRYFHVCRSQHVHEGERVGPVSLVLAQVLAQSVPPPPEAMPILLQGSLAEVNLRDVAAAVSLGRACVGIEVFAADGRRLGAVYLRGGKVLFAAWGQRRGRDALKDLFRPRHDGRFVMFRATDARIGQPIADLVDVLQPRRGTERSSSNFEAPSEEADEDSEVTLVVPPPAPPKPSSAPAEAFDEAAHRTGTRSVARKSFPPPSEAPRAQSEIPPAPRFRHSERPSGNPYSGSILLSDLGYGPRREAPAGTAKVICVTSARGGAGRTTVALNLAISLARRGHRVLLLDADENGVLPALHAPKRPYAGLADVLTGAADLGTALLDTRVAGLCLLPSGELSERTYSHSAWGALLSALAHRFDLVLIDCAPRLYGATLSALRCATHQLMVVAAEPAALRACETFQTRLSAELETPPKLLGIVLNMLDYQMRASIHALEELSESAFASAVFDIPIPRSPAFMEASARGVPIAHTESSAPLTIAWVFETLAAALLERLELEQPALGGSPLLT